MTAINAFLRPDRGFLMADGAFYTADGIPQGFGSKIVTIPKLHVAIASRGFSGICSTLAPNMAIRYSDFDDMIERVSDDLLLWSLEHQEFLEASGFPHFELHMMGWSKREGRPRHFIWTNVADNGDLVHNGLYEEPSNIMCPALGDAEAFEALPKLGVFVMNPQFAESFDPIRHGVPIMQAQRREVDELDGHEEGGKVCIVGGHIEVTEIDEAGISQRVLHRWADQAGETVEPEAMSPKDILRARIAARNAHLAAADQEAA